MSEKSSGERNLAPTEKRKREAARKGDVLRSKEVATSVAVITGALWLKLAGGWLMRGMENSAKAALEFGREDIEHFAPDRIMLNLVATLAPPLLTLGLAVIAVVFTAQLSIGEGRWVAGNLMPKPSRLNPLAGLKRMAGLQGLLELGKSLAKLVVLGGIAFLWGRRHLAGLLGLGRGDVPAQLALAWSAICDLLLFLALGLLAIALVDLPIQLFRRLGRLRMTQQEMRDEHKESEGSPEKKAAIRQRQRDLARGGIARAMKEAQFVITNPSHFAVAMTYDPKIAPAPVVLAKGRAEKALAMRELAREMNLPTLEYPSLARSVYFTTRENQVIRAELYAAVASVLAFVLSLKRGEKPVRPRVAVPVELQFDAAGKRLGS